jgi:hypothetical protein
MTTRISRQYAAARARTAQAVLGVLVVGGGAALAVGLRVGPRVEAVPATVTLPTVELASKTGVVTKVALDSSGIAERMDLVANHPIRVEAPPPDKVPPPPPPAPPAELRYLGAVMGSRNMALISDGGKQRFVTVGDSLAGGTIESISETEIKVGGNAPRTIDLANRAKDAVTKGHAPLRAAQPPQPAARPGAQPLGQASGLTVVKPTPPSPAPPTATAPGGGQNGEEVAPMPDSVRPEQSGRFEEVRSNLRQARAFGSERELADAAARIVNLEESDPKAAEQMLSKMTRKAPHP